MEKQPWGWSEGSVRVVVMGKLADFLAEYEPVRGIPLDSGHGSKRERADVCRVRGAARRRAIPLRLRFLVLARCNFRCAYCGATAQEARLQVDHIVPVARGGTNHESNLVAACRECNLGKSAMRLPSR